MFHPDELTPFRLLLTDLYSLASSSDYIREMRINEKLGALLTHLMEQSWHPESVTVSRKRMELAAVKEYLDEHYTEKLTLILFRDKIYPSIMYCLTSSSINLLYNLIHISYYISGNTGRRKRIITEYGRTKEPRNNHLPYKNIQQVWQMSIPTQ